MDSNRAVQINWGTFNVPTIISVLTVFFYMSTGNERQNARLDSIETTRETNLTQYATTMSAIQTKVAMVDNIIYRVTVLEQGIADVNRRIDRQTDSMQDIRDNIGTLSANFQVLSQKIETFINPRKAEMEITPFSRGAGVPHRN